MGGPNGAMKIPWGTMGVHGELMWALGGSMGGSWGTMWGAMGEHGFTQSRVDAVALIYSFILFQADLVPSIYLLILPQPHTPAAFIYLSSP